MFQPIIQTIELMNQTNLFNNPDNWESVPYNMNQDIQVGTELTATFNAVN